MNLLNLNQNLVFFGDSTHSLQNEPGLCLTKYVSLNEIQSALIRFFFLRYSVDVTAYVDATQIGAIRVGEEAHHGATAGGRSVGAGAGTVDRVVVGAGRRRGRRRPAGAVGVAQTAAAQRRRHARLVPPGARQSRYVYRYPVR